MFLMPVLLIVIMALIEDGPFRDYQELKIPVLLINSDSGSVGRSIERGLHDSKIFEIHSEKFTEQEAKNCIAKKSYDIAIVIPANASVQLNNRVDRFISKTMVNAGLPDSTFKNGNDKNLRELNVLIYFAPEIKKSFKTSVISSLRQFASRLETQTLIDNFSKKMNPAASDSTKQEGMQELISFREEPAIKNANPAFELNSVQHNVPAWTVFGMFFIVVSLAGSIIKEREDGSYLRILSMPGSYATVLAGKVSAYLFICLMQCVCMLLVGMYLLPLFNLPALSIGSNIAAIAIIVICCGLAATGFGILVGSVFTTHQQASTFGAVAIIILAALGGIWVPVYVMPASIRVLAELSPLHWALNAFYDIFLHAGTVQTILPNALKLLLFFGLTSSLAWFYNRVVKAD